MSIIAAICLISCVKSPDPSYQGIKGDVTGYEEDMYMIDSLTGALEPLRLVKFKFDRSHHLLSLVSSNEKISSYNSSVENKYNRRGQIIEHKETDMSGDVMDHTLYQYKGSVCILKTSNFNAGQKCVQTLTERVKDNDTLREVWTQVTGNDTSKIIYKYLKHYKCEETFNDDGTPLMTTEISYDDIGNIIDQKFFYKGEMYREILNEYDDETGLLLRSNSLYVHIKPKTSVFSYPDIDGKGNWTTRIRYSSGKMKTVTRRTYTYSK